MEKRYFIASIAGREGKQDFFTEEIVEVEMEKNGVKKHRDDKLSPLRG